MSWFPVGPNLVFAPVSAPADVGFKRLSRRNEGGWQGKVSAIAVDLTVTRPGAAGPGADGRDRAPRQPRRTENRPVPPLTTSDGSRAQTKGPIHGKSGHVR